MAETHYGVIETATGNLLRCGFSDFTSTLVAGESQRADCPFPGLTKRTFGLSQIHRWNGTAWVLAAFATGSGAILDGKVKVTTPVSGLTIPSLEAWYVTDNGDGTYSNKTRQVAYTYDAFSALTQKVETVYYSNGVVADTITYTYFTNQAVEAIEKKAVAL